MKVADSPVGEPQHASCSGYKKETRCLFIFFTDYLGAGSAGAGKIVYFAAPACQCPCLMETYTSGEEGRAEENQCG